MTAVLEELYKWVHEGDMGLLFSEEGVKDGKLRIRGIKKAGSFEQLVTTLKEDASGKLLAYLNYIPNKGQASSLYTDITDTKVETIKAILTAQHYVTHLADSLEKELPSFKVIPSKTSNPIQLTVAFDGLEHPLYFEVTSKNEIKIYPATLEPLLVEAPMVKTSWDEALSGLRDALLFAAGKKTYIQDDREQMVRLFEAWSKDPTLNVQENVGKLPGQKALVVNLQGRMDWVFTVTREKGEWKLHQELFQTETQSQNSLKALTDFLLKFSKLPNRLLKPDMKVEEAVPMGVEMELD